jgi:hypothetical protein
MAPCNWNRTLRLAAAGAALALAAHAAPAGAGDEGDDAGWALFLDNDAFTAGTHDHDYTGGIALTLAGRRAQRGWLSLDPALGAANRALGVQRRRASEWHAQQFAVLTFTPAELQAAAPVAGDRPYASIVYVANSRTTVLADAPTSSSVTCPPPRWRPSRSSSATRSPSRKHR